MNKKAKVNIRIFVIALLAYSLFMIPNVLAMSAKEVLALQPYGFLSFILAVGGLVVRFVRGKFPMFKRFFDICLAAVGIIISAPIVVLFAMLIKLFSPSGPVIYFQQRVGMGGRVFKIYKLRSMRPDAETGSGPIWAKERGDPRVIPVIGEFMRKTHIDELPQFLNVFKGDMSLVGPRPERPEMVQSLKEQVPGYEQRLRVRPGITGLAQVRHCYDRNIRDVKKKIKLDLLYIRKMCFLGELDIMVKTVVVIFTGQAIR